MHGTNSKLIPATNYRSLHYLSHVVTFICANPSPAVDAMLCLIGSRETLERHRLKIGGPHQDNIP